MGKVILDDELKAKLGEVKGEVELCDAEGRTVAYVLDPEWHRTMLYAWAKAQFSAEVAEGARQDYRKNGGMTTAQVLEYLKSLDEPKAGGA
jgi:hypothetical protein